MDADGFGSCRRVFPRQLQFRFTACCLRACSCGCTHPLKTFYRSRTLSASLDCNCPIDMQISDTFRIPHVRTDIELISPLFHHIAGFISRRPAVVIGRQHKIRSRHHQQLFFSRLQFPGLCKCSQTPQRLPQLPLRRFHIDLHHFFSAYIPHISYLHGKLHRKA